MYIAISAQKKGTTYSNSVSDYVSYLEKENNERDESLQENFFNQYEDNINPSKVISEIDGNTKKLRKRDPKFYSIIVSPSSKELNHINNNPETLRNYVRELMKEYANSFHRNRSVAVDDIKYFAKIEHERTYRGFEKKIQENAPYRKQIVKLQNDIRKIQRGELKGKTKQLRNEIQRLRLEAPHKINGHLLTAGMQKEGLQTHVHIIISRKDMSNQHILSPMSKYKASQVELNGKIVKRGFDRNRFYEKAEKTFDNHTGYKRNYVETFLAKKAFVLDPKKFYAKLIGLPTNERALAFKIMSKIGIQISAPPTNHLQLTLKAYRRLQKGMKIAIRSASIEI